MPTLEKSVATHVTADGATLPPSQTVACIVTDQFGRIVEALEDGAKALNLSPRGVQGRALPLFIVHDRPTLMRHIEVASRGHSVVLETLFQPRERARRRATVQIDRLPNEGADIELHWRIELE